MMLLRWQLMLLAQRALRLLLFIRYDAMLMPCVTPVFRHVARYGHA